MEDLFKKLGESVKTNKDLILPDLPTAPKFKTWRNRVRLQVSQHMPKRADDVMEWILKVEKKDITYVELGNSDDFYELDIVLAAAIGKILVGELGRKIHQLIDDTVKIHRKPPRGRQLLWHIYSYNKTAVDAGAIYDITDIIKVAWLGDERRLILGNNCRSEQTLIQLKRNDD